MFRKARFLNLIRVVACTTMGLSFVGMIPASAQINNRRPDPGNRLFNPFRVEFKPAWNMLFQEPVKLIDVGPVTDVRRSNLVLLVAGSTDTDTQRKLRILHWNGLHFDQDVELASQSAGIDTLLLGRFQPDTTAPAVTPAKTTGTAGPKAAKSKPKPSSRGSQVLTNTGVYIWSGSGLQNLYARQIPDVKQSISREEGTDIVLVGAGDGTTPYEFNETELHPSPPMALKGAGYVHFGIGTQPFPGSDTMNITSGVRFAQSIWVGRTKWMIGLMRGKPAATTADPAATTGDKLVVYTPKFASRDKTFWETRSDDLEESWESDPLPGRVLDVRVGDPHNDGKLGILVLTSENNDHDRRLTFFSVSGNG